MIFFSRVFFLSAVFWFIACEDSEKQVSENFRNAYLEMRTFTEVYKTKPEAAYYRKKILEKYGFSKETFSAEAHKLMGNYTLWVSFEKDLMASLDTLLNKSQEEQNKQKTLKPKRTQSLSVD